MNEWMNELRNSVPWKPFGYVPKHPGTVHMYDRQTDWLPTIIAVAHTETAAHSKKLEMISA